VTIQIGFKPTLKPNVKTKHQF